MKSGFVEDAGPLRTNSSLPTSKRNRARKVTASGFARALSGRGLHPGHLYQAWKLRAQRKAQPRMFDDTQLALYARIFPTGFLHYGYFDNPEVQPEHISINDLEHAQMNYARLLLDRVDDAGAPVLDIGCGMGGIARMLGEAGFATTALTPDRAQAAHIESTLPNIPVVRTKFERWDVDEHRGVVTVHANCGLGG